MKKSITILFVLALVLCVGIAGIAFASAPSVTINADVYYGDYVGDREELTGKATIAFGEAINVTTEEYGVVVATYGDEWSGEPSELKYYAKSNLNGKFGVAVYGLTDGFYGLKTYVYDKSAEAYDFSAEEIRIQIGYSAVTLVQPETENVVKYVKTGTAFADPEIEGVDVWNTKEGEIYTPYDFSAVVNGDITLYAETISYELSSNEPIVLYTNTSLSGTPYSAEAVTLPTLTATSSLKGEYAVDTAWTKATGNPNLVIEDGMISATGKKSGTAVIKSGDYELNVTVKSPVFGAKDLDELSLVTFYGDVVASSEYYGEAQVYLDGYYELMNDIDYAAYERANDTYNYSRISSKAADGYTMPKYGYMLPIATFAPASIRNSIAIPYQEMTVNINNVSTQTSSPAYFGHSSATPYSKTWLSILGNYLEEAISDYTVPNDASDFAAAKGQTYKLYEMKIKAGITEDGEQAEFMGINPKARSFRGTLDGAGNTISNAWLMLDNYGVLSSPNSGIAYSSVAYGHYMHLVGVNEGTVENIVFDNMGIGSIVDYYGYTATSDTMDMSIYALLGYSGINGTKGLGVATSIALSNDTSIRHYYKLYNDKDTTVIHPVQLQTENGTIVAESYGSALVGINSGNINNVVMNYRSSASRFKSSSDSNNQVTDANGLCYINETRGNISNVIINRMFDSTKAFDKGDFGLALWGKYYGSDTRERSTRAISGDLQTGYIVANRNKGNVNQVYVFNNQAVSSTALRGTGEFNITIVSINGSINVAGMDTTNCNQFLKDYVAGLNA